jgi:predicted metalloprotease
MARRFVLALAIVLTLLAPSVVKAQTAADAIAADIDAWWSAEFAARGLAYTSPQLELVTEPGTEFCNFIDVFFAPAGYCSTNQEITISTGFVSPDDVAVLLPLISHEWGHHIQNLIDTGASTPLEQELQADCFAGAFIAFAADSDWISPVVAAMALQLTQSAGDVWWEGTFDEAIHGTKADRAIAFMAGQSGGLEACGL